MGRIGGKAVVQRVTDEESEAINGFFGWNCKPGDTVSIPLALFEEELKGSAFALGLADLHLLLEGTPLLSKSERLQMEDEERHRFFREVRARAGNLSWFSDGWLTRLEKGQGAGWRTVRELYESDREQALTALVIVVHALDFLFAEDRDGAKPAVRLPVLAARISGDAHALDRNQPAGRILLAVLAEEADRGSGAVEDRRADAAGTDAEHFPAWKESVLVKGETEMTTETEKLIEGAMENYPQTVRLVDGEGEEASETLKFREIYRRFGILDDDLSSIVHWFVPDSGGPALPKVWTLREVEAADSLPRCSSIYIVENPSVFSTILDSIWPQSYSDAPPALICTSGPASAAAIRWMQKCMRVSGGTCRLYYSGDFDLKGLSMGVTLARLFPDRFVPWRFDGETYREAVQAGPGPVFDDIELKKLAVIEVGWDRSLCAHMCVMKRKVHQEVFVDLLVQDFISAILS